MRLRAFITILGSASLAWPLPAGAQQTEQVRRVGVLMGYAESDREGQAFVASFRDGLQKLGWAEGRNCDGAILADQRAVHAIALRPPFVLDHEYRLAPGSKRANDNRATNRRMSD